MKILAGWKHDNSYSASRSEFTTLRAAMKWAKAHYMRGSIKPLCLFYVAEGDDTTFVKYWNGKRWTKPQVYY